MKFRLLSSKREVQIVPISFGLVKKRVAKWPISVILLSCLYIYIYMYIVYKVLSIYRFLPGFREFAVFEKSKRFFYIFFGWVLHRGGQGPGKGPNVCMYVCMYVYYDTTSTL